MPGRRVFGVDLRINRTTTTTTTTATTVPPASPPLDAAPPQYNKYAVAPSSPSASSFVQSSPDRDGIDYAVRSPHMDHFKRPALSALGKKHSSNDKRKSRSRSNDPTKNHATATTTTAARDSSSRTFQPHVHVPNSPLHPARPVKLDMLMESPPALFIDPPQQSTGALISGRLQVSPATTADVTLESIVMFLEATTTVKRPVHDRCRECMTTVNDLYEWNFLTRPTVFHAAKGTHELPFSHLIPGHLPTTTHGHLATLDYSLHVRARAASGQEIEFRRELIIHRALRPGNDKNSIRIFPPTNLNLHVTLPSIIHPIGEFPVQCRMTGIVAKKDDTQTRWKLRKLTWRIEEHEEMISPACAKHAPKIGGEGKGIKHDNTREIGMEELKQGWKTDFSDDRVEGEFMAAIDPASKPQCDVDAPNGLKISHILVLELVIAEEWAPNKKPTQATPTGAARVLRTQFNLNVTERAGLGIAWDDEMPPVYEDIPPSPPRYQNEQTVIEDCDPATLNDDIAQLTL